MESILISIWQWIFLFSVISGFLGMSLNMVGNNLGDEIENLAGAIFLLLFTFPFFIIGGLLYLFGKLVDSIIKLFKT